MTRKIAGERRRAGERKDEFDSRIKGLKLHVIVTTRFLSQAPLDFFFGKFFFFRMDWTHFVSKKKAQFFFIFSFRMDWPSVIFHGRDDQSTEEVVKVEG